MAKCGDHSPSDYQFFKHLSIILNDITFRSKQEVELNFIDFVALRPIKFCQQGVDNLVDRCKEASPLKARILTKFHFSAVKFYFFSVRFSR